MNNETNYSMTWDLAKGEDTSAQWNLIRHEFKGIIKMTDKAHLFQLVDRPNKAVWVPKSMTIGMSVNPINKHIICYIPDYCKTVEVDL